MFSKSDAYKLLVTELVVYVMMQSSHIKMVHEGTNNDGTIVYVITYKMADECFSCFKTTRQRTATVENMVPNFKFVRIVIHVKQTWYICDLHPL